MKATGKSASETSAARQSEVALALLASDLSDPG